MDGNSDSGSQNSWEVVSDRDIVVDLVDWSVDGSSVRSGSSGLESARQSLDTAETDLEELCSDVSEARDADVDEYFDSIMDHEGTGVWQEESLESNWVEENTQRLLEDTLKKNLRDAEAALIMTLTDSVTKRNDTAYARREVLVNADRVHEVIYQDAAKVTDIVAITPAREVKCELLRSEPKCNEKRWLAPKDLLVGIAPECSASRTRRFVDLETQQSPLDDLLNSSKSVRYWRSPVTQVPFTLLDGVQNTDDYRPNFMTMPFATEEKKVRLRQQFGVAKKTCYPLHSLIKWRVTIARTPHQHKTMQPKSCAPKRFLWSTYVKLVMQDKARAECRTLMKRLGLTTFARDPMSLTTSPLINKSGFISGTLSPRCDSGILALRSEVNLLRGENLQLAARMPLRFAHMPSTSLYPYPRLSRFEEERLRFVACSAICIAHRLGLVRDGLVVPFPRYMRREQLCLRDIAYSSEPCPQCTQVEQRHSVPAICHGRPRPSIEPERLSITDGIERSVGAIVSVASDIVSFAQLQLIQLLVRPARMPGQLLLLAVLCVSIMYASSYKFDLLDTRMEFLDNRVQELETENANLMGQIDTMHRLRRVDELVYSLNGALSEIAIELSVKDGRIVDMTDELVALHVSVKGVQQVLDRSLSDATTVTIDGAHEVLANSTVASVSTAVKRIRSSFSSVRKEIRANSTSIADSWLSAFRKPAVAETCKVRKNLRAKGCKQPEVPEDKTPEVSKCGKKEEKESKAQKVKASKAQKVKASEKQKVKASKKQKVKAIKKQKAKKEVHLEEDSAEEDALLRHRRMEAKLQAEAEKKAEDDAERARRAKAKATVEAKVEAKAEAKAKKARKTDSPKAGKDRKSRREEAEARADEIEEEVALRLQQLREYAFRGVFYIMNFFE